MRRCKVAAGAAAALASLMLCTVTAFACIPIAMLSLSQDSAAPGSQVTARIHQINDSSYPAISFHWQTLDGPVLATATPTSAGVTATFTVPQAQPGDYMVIATTTLKDPAAHFTSADNATWGMPARAILHVTGPGGTSGLPASAGTNGSTATSPAFATDSGPGMGVLVLLGAAVAGAALLIAGATLWATSRRPQPEATTAR